MCFGGAGDGGASAQARQDEQARQGRISSGMDSIDQTFSKFDDNYFNDYFNKAMDMAKPNITKQFTDANEQTLFGLARDGNLQSSAAAKMYGNVSDRKNDALLNASNTANNDKNALRSEISGQRGQLVNQLQATADPGAAAAGAISEAAASSRPPTYSPITNIFSDLTSQFAANEQARAFGMPGLGFGITPQYSPTTGSPKSVQVVA